MKKILLFALPLLAMIAVSCEKDSKTYSGPTKLVKEIYADGELYMSFEYNDDGTVSKLNVTGGSNYEIKYSGNEIIIDASNNVDSYKEILNLDVEGYVISDEDATYEYKNGYLSKKHYTDADEYIFYVWKNGNIYMDDTNLEYSGIKNITNYDFNIFAGCPTFIPYTRYKGVTSTNLAKKADDIYFEYKLDDDGAPIQMIANWRDNKSIYTITYVE